MGGSLFPYLFVLCMEILGQWLSNIVTEGMLKDLRALRSGLKISHMFFADNLLLFSEAEEMQLECIKEGLDSFCKC